MSPEAFRERCAWMAGAYARQAAREVDPAWRAAYEAGARVFVALASGDDDLPPGTPEWLRHHIAGVVEGWLTA
jgi:hypothetical protein